MHECNLIPDRRKGSEDDEVWMSFAKKVDVLTMSRNLLLLFRKKMLHPIRCKTFAELSKHLVDMHGKDSSIEKKTFASFDAFLVWKKLKEQESNSLFVQHRQKRICKDNETYYFYCSRTGYLQERKRALKPQGPSKIDGKCSAFMKVVVDSVSKEVNVEYNLFHIGHDTRLGHL